MLTLLTVLIFVSLFLFVFLLLFDAFPTKADVKKPFEQKVKKIKKDRNKSYVLALMGKPQKMIFYPNGDYEYVYVYKYGRLSEFARIAKVLFSAKTDRVIFIEKNFDK